MSIHESASLYILLLMKRAIVFKEKIGYVLIIENSEYIVKHIFVNVNDSMQDGFKLY